MEIKTGAVSGVKTDAVDLHRFAATHAAMRPLAHRHFRPLTAPRQVWHFDLLAPPTEAEVLELDFDVTAAGEANAVVFWMEAHLYGDVHLSTAPSQADEMPWPGPGLQYLPGWGRVGTGERVVVRCSHNTVRMRFDLDPRDFERVPRTDLAFQHSLFARWVSARLGASHCARLLGVHLGETPASGDLSLRVAWVCEPVIGEHSKVDYGRT